MKYLWCGVTLKTQFAYGTSKGPFTVGGRMVDLGRQWTVFVGGGRDWGWR